MKRVGVSDQDLDTVAGFDKSISDKKAKMRKQANRNRSRGRGQQNRVARLTGGANVGHLGGQDVGFSSKIFDVSVSIETKHLNRFAGERIMAQAEKNCPKGHVPVAWVHVNKKRIVNDIVMVRIRDLGRLKLAIAEGFDESVLHDG